MLEIDRIEAIDRIERIFVRIDRIERIKKWYHSMQNRTISIKNVEFNFQKKVEEVDVEIKCKKNS